MDDILIEYLLQANELLQFGEEEPDTVEQVQIRLDLDIYLF